MKNNFGFYISKLVLQSGSSKPDAVIDFDPGCNVIYGASNTGKTFILQCVDFLFGAGSKPKDIPEANGYNYAFLEIKTHSGSVLTLMRDLKDPSKTYKSSSTIDEFWKLKEKNDVEILNSANRSSKESRPLSQFLLEISGFKGDEVVRTNSENKKRNLSFRDISHLTVINEETIIRETSPVFNTNNTNETAEGAAFQLLITGEDSSELLELEDMSTKRSNLNAQIKLIEDMSKDLAEKVSLSKKKHSQDDVSIEEDISKINDQYIEIQQAIEKKSKLRQETWLKLEKYKNRLTSLKELLLRFKILKSQYEIDLKRLNFIDEGEYLLSQLNSTKCICPVCNSELNSSNLISLDLKNSIKSETNKIKLNLSELITTIDINKQEQLELEKLIDSESRNYSDCEEEITRNLEPFKASIQSKLQDLVARQKRILNLNSMRGQISTLSDKKNELLALLEQLKKIPGSKGVINKEKLNKFVELVKSFLVDWKYLSENSFVDFDKDWRVLDISIDGISRSSNGKGVRALLHSAFVLGILKHCFNENLPHPLVVLLDTPLHSFKGKDSAFKDRETAEKVKNAFFDFMASWPKDMQVIIFENEEPPQNILDKIKCHYFSGTEGVGDVAFIPVNKDSDTNSKN